MRENVQFCEATSLRLLPVGQGFVPSENLRGLEDPVEIDRITSARRNFQRLSIGRNEQRKTRDQKPFICKSAYILSRRCTSFHENEIIALLSDSSTLFSYDYQTYSQDHAFYRERRSYQGNSPEQQTSYCREQALKGVGLERTQYEKYLMCLEKKISQEGWTPEQFEDEIVECATRGFVRKEDIENFFLWVEDCIASEDFKSHFLIVPSEIQLTRQDCGRFSDDFMNVLKSEECYQIQFFRKFLTFQCPEFCHTYEVLQDWIPDFQRKPDEEDFFSKVLYSYISARKRLPIEKESAGHYTPTYRICDKISCHVYLKTQQYLKELRARQKSWIRDDISNAFGILWEDADYSIDPRSSDASLSPETGRLISMIYNVTKDYFSRTGGHPEGHLGKFDVRNVKSVVSSIESLDIDISDFPFCYLLVCIAGTRALFSTEKVVRGSNISRTLQHPYYQKPSRKKQRISRIRFLNDLNNIMELDKEKRSHNWNLFLQVHGSAIESTEEAALWCEILYDKSKKQLKEDIPPIEISVLCYDLLQQCLPVQEQYLYCYCSSSILQEGGYAKFLEEQPDVLRECVKRMEGKASGKDAPQMKYLKACSGITYDVNLIQNICGELSSSIRWGTISHASKSELEVFCRSCYNAQNVTDVEISGDVKELKNLLIETALRHILAEDAAKKLKERTEIVFNEGTEFEISLSNL